MLDTDMNYNANMNNSDNMEYRHVNLAILANLFVIA